VQQNLGIKIKLSVVPTYVQTHHQMTAESTIDSKAIILIYDAHHEQTKNVVVDPTFQSIKSQRFNSKPTLCMCAKERGHKLQLQTIALSQ
jgi:hypothetical protein